MKMIAGYMALVIVLGSVSVAQFKPRSEEKPTVSESLVRNDEGGLLFGWFDPSRLTMHQSFSLSYTTFGSQGYSLGVYTNSLFYKFSDPLSVQFDVSLMHSPFNTFGDQFSKSMSGIFLSRAQLNYRPADNMLFHVEFRQVPGYSFGNYYQPNLFFGTDRYEEGAH